MPTLGIPAGVFAHGEGFGEVRPARVFNGGDPTGLISSIRWAGWGGTQATGTGLSDYVGPGQTVAEGTEETATIVVFDLGECAGQFMYQAVEWYFPQHGDRFDPTTYEDVCHGTYVNGDLTTSGQVGDLQLGEATASDVESMDGPPAETADGSVGLPSAAPYEALGYDCGPGVAVLDAAPTPANRVGGVACGAVFYIDRTTGQLGGFVTVTDRYQTKAGSRVGLSESQVQAHDDVGLLDC